MMMDEQKDSTVKSSILSINNLQYVLQPDLSVAVSKTMVKQFPQQSKHVPRDSMIFTLNSGSNYLDLKESYLSVDVKCTSVSADGKTSTSATFGAGSACNLFNRLTISSRSGQIIERIDRANQLASIRQYYERSPSWATGPGSAMNIPTTEVWGGGVTRRFVIPLSMLSVFADTCDQILPAQLASGLRFELLMEDSQVALKSASATDIPGYEVTAASLNLSSYILSDVVLRTINESSASTGLELVHQTIYSAIGQRTGTLLNTELGRAASRVLKCVYRERPLYTSPAQDNFVSPTWSDTYYVQESQTRLGSLFFPNTSLRGDSPYLMGPELYSQALMAFSTYTQTRPESNVSELEFRQGKAIIAQTFERSNVLDLSGVPTSSSRIINLNARFSDGTTRDSEFYLYYVQLLRIFSSNVTVEN